MILGSYTNIMHDIIFNFFFEYIKLYFILKFTALTHGRKLGSIFKDLLDSQVIGHQLILFKYLVLMLANFCFRMYIADDIRIYTISVNGKISSGQYHASTAPVSRCSGKRRGL